MHKATGEQKYLDYAISGYGEYGLANSKDILSWDSKVGGIKVLLNQLTGQYTDDVIKMCDYLINEVRKSPNGLTFIDQWGSLRHTSNSAFVCLQVEKFFYINSSIAMLSRLLITNFNYIKMKQH